MSKPVRAVLRNENNEHIARLTPEQIEIYELLAERGEVQRAHKMKKGRLCIIFRQLPEPEPQVKPSESQDSSCMLTDDDSQAIAGCYGETTRRQRERWMGWGLIPAYA